MSTKLLRILVIICTTRPGALGPAVGEWLLKSVGHRATELGVDLVPVALGDLDLPFLDEEQHPSTGIYHNEHTRQWSSIVDAADGFIVVTPEYNYGMPATLKNALDYLSREWAWKPMGFISYGNTSAGTRSVQHAKQVITTLRLVPLGATLAIRISESIRDGQVVSNPFMESAATGVLDELVRLSHALRPMREAEHNGSTPGPIPGSYVRQLTPDDAAEVLVLQRCSWVDEALANGSLAIPALHESLQDVREWLGSWHGLGLWLDRRLIGMVRGQRDNTDWRIGRLAIAPDQRGHGLGRWLLHAIEAAADPACQRMTLTTGARSYGNIRLYESEGYHQVATNTQDGTTSLARMAR